MFYRQIIEFPLEIPFYSHLATKLKVARAINQNFV